MQTNCLSAIKTFRIISVKNVAYFVFDNNFMQIKIEFQFFRTKTFSTSFPLYASRPIHIFSWNSNSFPSTTTRKINTKSNRSMEKGFCKYECVPKIFWQQSLLPFMLNTCEVFAENTCRKELLVSSTFKIISRNK